MRTEQRTLAAYLPYILLVVIAVVVAVIVFLGISGSQRRGADALQEQQTEQEAVGDKEPQQEKSVEALTYYITDATTYVSMRSEADNRSDVTGKLYNGNSVEVLSCDGDYWYVYSRDMGAYGYVDSAYLTAAREQVSYNSGQALQPDFKQVTGISAAPSVYAPVYYTHVIKGYLALRDEPANSDRNIIAKLYNNDAVRVIDAVDTYWYVYAEAVGMYGYVNSGYLTAQPVSNTISYYASVDKGYLALRSEEAYASSNEIGKLYNGDRVDVLDFSGLYWYVYAPSLGRYGYVNSRYLVR